MKSIVYIRTRDVAPLCFNHAIKAVMLQDERVDSHPTEAQIQCAECLKFQKAEQSRHTLRDFA